MLDFQHFKVAEVPTWAVAAIRRKCYGKTEPQTPIAS